MKIKHLVSITSFLPPAVITKAIKKTVKAYFKENAHLLNILITPPPQNIPSLERVPNILPMQSPITTQQPPAPLESPSYTHITKIQRLWSLAVVLDTLLSLVSPCEVPPESPAYPLFLCGTKILTLDGALKHLDSARPSELKKVLTQPFFLLGRAARLTARAVHMCSLLYIHLRLNTPKKQGILAATEQLTATLATLEDTLAAQARQADETHAAVHEQERLIRTMQDLSAAEHTLLQRASVREPLSPTRLAQSRRVLAYFQIPVSP